MLLVVFYRSLSATNSPYTYHNGRPSELPTQLSNHQVRYHHRSLELQYVPLGTPFLHLRMSELQAQDLPALRSQSLGELPTQNHQLLRPAVLQLPIVA